MEKARKTRIRAAAVTLAVAAVAALLALPAFAANVGKDRPYKISGTQKGTFDFTEYPSFEFDVIGPAIASHLGKTTVRSFGSNEGSISIYTAANGDELHGTGAPADTIPDGIVCPAMPGYGGLGGPYPYSDNNSYDGGTGPFANAHGTSVSVGCLYFSDSDTWPLR
jgi:hypothetical protein